MLIRPVWTFRCLIWRKIGDRSNHKLDGELRSRFSDDSKLKERVGYHRPYTVRFLRKENSGGNSDTFAFRAAGRPLFDNNMIEITHLGIYPKPSNS